jgi:TonB-linked SusC/RagA family outer membrane protein
MKNSLLWRQNFAGRRVAPILLVMKLTALLVIVFSIQATARVHSQDKVTLRVKDGSLVSVLKEIRKQTGYLYSIMDEYSDKALKVNISVNQVPLEEALAMVFRDQPLSYTIIERTIVVKQKTVAAVTPVTPSDAARIIKVEGEVMNMEGQPLSGASVTIKGTNKSVLTNERGEFSFTAIPADAQLLVSYIGYAPKQVPIQEGQKIRVALAVADNTLDQSVVIAYGTTTRRLNTGDVSTVKSEEIEMQPINNPLEAIEGRVPGLFITQQSGMPGTNFNVQIRGQNSIANGNDPLYVIDGVPYPSQELGSGIHFGSPLNFINPSDIESIDVLKDADATAIYGSRGANGVILVTTKKGKTGSLRGNINMSSGIGQVGHFMHLMNTSQYLQMRREAITNDGDSLSDPNLYAPDLLLWDTTRYTDWQKKLIGGTAHYTDIQASISGGSLNTQYLFGGGYHKQTTVFPGNYADQKGSIHFNITTASNDQKLKLSLSGAYMIDQMNLPSDLTSSISLAPDAPSVYKSDGTLNWEPNASGSSTWYNPFSNLLLLYKANSNNLVSNGTISYKLLRGLEFKASGGYTNLEIKETNASPIASYDPSLKKTTGSNYFADNNIHSWILEPQLNYQNASKWGSVDVLIGSTLLQSTSNGQRISATGFSSDALLYDILAATKLTGAYITNAVYKYNAMFGRVNYKWQDKYIIDLTARRDGSSRFGPGRQFANFAAVGAAWIFSKEYFVQQTLSFLSFGKFRGSYGTTGNDQIGDYHFLDLYRSGGYTYQGVSTLYTNSLSNPNFAWEKNKKLEGGVDLGFLHDRILFTANYFWNRSSNQLLQYVLPSITGFASITENLPAVVQNTGWEFIFNSTNVKTNSFRWTSSFNITIHKNALISFPNFSTSGYQTLFVIGKPLSVIQAYHAIGVNDTTGVYQFDSKSDTYNPSYLTDRTKLIDINPKFYGGLQNTFQLGGFQLDIYLQFVKQTGLNYLYQFSANPPGFEGYNAPAAILNNWKHPGSHSNFQQFTQTYGNAYNAYSSYLNASDLSYTDASYIRIKNVSISYLLPKKWIGRMHLQSCKFYLQAENLVTFTNHYQGLDPETQSVSSLPLLRTITTGLQIGL